MFRFYQSHQYRLLRVALLLILIESTLGVKAPCYGYGSIMGSPSKYLKDDYDNVEKLKIGQDGTYLAYIDFLFEGRNHLSFGYYNTSDRDFSETSWMHGAVTNIRTERYNLRNEKSRIL